MNRLLTMLLAAGLLLPACAPAAESPTSPLPHTPLTAAGDRMLTVMGHDSFAISESVVEAFEAQHNVDVQFLQAGDTGTALNKAILARGNPLADVFYGVDNTFLTRALEEDIFLPYDSPALAAIPDRFKLDPQNRALPVDYGDVCLNYDKAYFEAEDLAPPANLEALLEPAYADLLVVENPATSSPGLAFLLATIGRFGEAGYLDYWQGLVDNGLLVVNDWDSAYYGEFTLHGGTRPLVVSYGSSPPAEVYFAEQPPNEAPTGVVTADESCFRQIEFVGILNGTPHRQLAELWVDFMLSTTFQEDMPLNMFVFPVLPDAVLPPVFAEHLVVPETTADIEADAISANRQAWIEAWTETVLR